ncbi:MAG: fumarylacetoacetate hydrolase family protein [Armatimonadota bacterium]|nr:fumarylacetoacetate hydrolase family protein [Armatimonadota bacterium]
MRRMFAAAAIAALATGALRAQAPLPARSAEPFKLGTFDLDGEDRLGLVLRDRFVVDLHAANRALERDPVYPKIPMPADMLELIGRYEYGLKYRLYEIVGYLAAENRIERARPAYVHDAARVRALAPIKYPTKMLNAAVNYYGHISETATPEEQRKAQEERRRDRGIPYLFHKTTVGAIIGNGDPIVMPYGRDRMDWEVELGVVIGRAARYVPAARAADHIFGYTIHLDMSDRGGRPPGGFQGVDWYVGKGHDTFAPLGPWIVPKEFYGDPMNVRQTLTVNGQTMQDHRSSDMIHNIYELIEYASSISTLFPGDVVNAGSGAGVGMGTAVRGEQVFLKPGDKIVATIEGIGTLTHEVVAGPRPAHWEGDRGTGSALPPVRSYRR